MMVKRSLRSHLWILGLALAVSVVGLAPGIGQEPTPAKWTIMIYMPADNRSESAAIDAVNYMETAAITIYDPEVVAVVQMDRIKIDQNPPAWDDNRSGDWFTAHRFRIVHDDNDNPDDIFSDSDPALLNDIGEVDMADPSTLADFVSWAMTTYPADNYALILWDYCYDWMNEPYGENPVRTSIYDYTPPPGYYGYGHMNISQLNYAFGRCSGVLGERVPVVVLDTDFMATMEALHVINPNIRYLVAAEHAMWGAAYPWILEALLAYPDASPAELADFISTWGVWVYPPGVIGAEEAYVPAIDCVQMPAVSTALSSFATELRNAFLADPNGPLAPKIHTYWEIANLEPVGLPLEEDYIDLACFAELISTTATTEALRNAAESLVAAVRRAVIAEDFSEIRWGPHQGISIYHPFNVMPRQEYMWTKLAGDTTWDEWIYTQPIGWGYWPDSFEPDGSVEEAKPINVGYDQGWHWFHGADDMDMASFHAEAGRLYGVGTENRGRYCLPYMGIVGLDNASIVAESIDPYLNYLIWLCRESGTYHVIVSQMDQYGLWQVPHLDGGWTYYSLWAAPVFFGDVYPSHWAFRYVAACAEAGIVGGYPDGSYAPWRPVTRDQMAAYVARALAGGDAEVPEGPLAASFSDVPVGHWAYKYVEYAKAQGVVGGYPTGDFRPQVPLDRGQMAAFIARAMAGGDENVPDSPTGRLYRDVTPDHWAYRYIQYIVKEGVSTGYRGGTYRPEAACTRDQMAVFAARAFLPPITASPIP